MKRQATGKMALSRFSHLSRLRGLSFCAVLLIASTIEADNALGGSGTPAGDRPELCQVAALRNGFTIRYTRHEVAGLATRLWVCADAGVGYVEVPSEQIENFEQGPNAVATAAPASASETTASGRVPVKDPIRNLIVSAASRYQIDPDFVFSVVKAESGFNPTAISPKGARGLMQLMPQTAARLGIENVFDPAANVEGGTKYLRHLLDLYDGDAVKALAAYNAGPQRVEQYGGIPPYRETWAYVARIIDDYNRKKVQQQAQSTAASAHK
jgi:soluble lytic murein transglycosylase-like protein